MANAMFLRRLKRVVEESGNVRQRRVDIVGDDQPAGDRQQALAGLLLDLPPDLVGAKCQRRVMRTLPDREPRDPGVAVG